jgi:hypothetical protein
MLRGLVADPELATRTWHQVRHERRFGKGLSPFEPLPIVSHLSVGPRKVVRPGHLRASCHGALGPEPSRVACQP